MASPVSIGDAILLSKLAYQLGHTLTVGRKQAAADVREVQNHLYCLSKALDIIGHATGPDALRPLPMAKNNQEPQMALEAVIEGCRQTLRALESFTNKFAHDQSSAAKTNKNEAPMKKLRNDLWANWKNVKWTMDGTKLKDLRASLHTHVTTLALFLDGQNSLRTQSMQTSVEEVHSMVTELHKWINETVRGRPATSGVREAQSESRSTVATSPAPGVFQLSVDLEVLPDPVLLCNRATFRDGWTTAFIATERGRDGIFQCCCDKSKDPKEADKHIKSLQCSLLPISLIVKNLGPERSWHLYGHAKKVTSFRIMQVSPEHMAWFQDQVNHLAEKQVIRSLSTTRSTSLIYRSRSEECNLVSILDAKSIFASLSGTISSVEFHIGENHFLQHSIDTVQMLHYRTDCAAEEHAPSNLSHQPYCELVLSVQPTATQCAKMTIQLHRNTACSRIENSKVVQILDADCQSEGMDGSKDQLRCDRVEFTSTTYDGAERLATTIESVIQQLRIHYLESPLLGERVVAEKVCPDIVLDETYLKDPSAQIVLDPVSNLYRLILRSSLRDAVVTIELPEALRMNLIDDATQSSDTRVEAHFVRHEEDGTEVDTRLVQFPQEVLSAPDDELEQLRISGQ